MLDKENLKTDLIELMKKYNFETNESVEDDVMSFCAYENDEYLGSVLISFSIN